MGNTYLIGHIFVVLGVCLSTWATNTVSPEQRCLRNIYNDSIYVIRHFTKVNCSGSLEPPLRKSHHRRSITSNETFGDQHQCIFELVHFRRKCPSDLGNNNKMRVINKIRCLLQDSINNSKECEVKNKRPRIRISKKKFLHCWCRFLSANPNA